MDQVPWNDVPLYLLRTRRAAVSFLGAVPPAQTSDREQNEQRDRGRQRLQEPDAAVRGGAAIETRRQHAGEKEQRKRSCVSPRGEQRPDQPRGEKAVVETLVRGEHPRLLGLFGAHPERRAGARRGP